jgi:hypothetical protein
MKIFFKVLLTFLVLLGVAFLVILGRASAADEAKCGLGEFRFGLDANGCDKTALPLSEDQIHGLLKAAGVGQECYKIRYWDKDGHWVKDEGTLDMVQCMTKEDAKSGSANPQMLQPSGAGSTQRIMFYTPAAREAFDRQSKATKKK